MTRTLACFLNRFHLSPDFRAMIRPGSLTSLLVSCALPVTPMPIKAGRVTAKASDSLNKSAVTNSANHTPFFAPSLTATLADDIGLGARKNPGDTITYTATITNGGASPADDATGMVFSAILDNSTTLVGGSVNAQPIAKPDSYTGSGNIPISIAAPGVLTNDVDPMTGTNTGLTVTEVQGLPGNVVPLLLPRSIRNGLVRSSLTAMRSAGGDQVRREEHSALGRNTF